MIEFMITALALLLPLVFPAYTVWRHPNWKGVALGTFTLWVFMLLGEAFLLGRYGSDGPGGALLAIWFVLGLPLSAAFCGVVRLIRRLAKKKEGAVLPGG